MVNISIGGLRVHGKPGTIDTMNEDIKSRIITGNLLFEDYQWIIDRYEQLQMLLDEKDKIFLNLKAYFGRKITVTQKLTVTADALTQTTVMNDTLITKGNPIGFRWDDPRFQDRSINVNVATGVQPWEHIWSLKAHARRAVQPVVDEDTGVITWRLGEGMVTHVYNQKTYLQRLEWQQIGGKWKLRPYHWKIGMEVDLTQDIVYDKEVILP